MASKVRIFICYAHRDEPLLKELIKHLSPLWQEGVIDVWDDRQIRAGSEWEQEITKRLNEAHIILLLVSPDFLASALVYSRVLNQALSRHYRQEARVIPIILRQVYWKKAPFGRLQALPKDAQPVTSWRNLDEAFFDVEEGIRKVVEIEQQKLIYKERQRVQQWVTQQRQAQLEQDRRNELQTALPALEH